MQCLCRLVYTRCISVHWLNKVPARKSHIDSLCQDLLAVQIVGTTKEHVQKVPMNTWEWKSREPKLLLICRQADLQATLPLNKHSKTQGLRTHREELSYLAEWQGLKDLLSPAWPELGSMIWSPGASMNRDPSSQPPNGGEYPAQITSRTPALQISLQSHAHNNSWPQLALTHYFSGLLKDTCHPAFFVISIWFIHCTLTKT